VHRIPSGISVDESKLAGRFRQYGVTQRLVGLETGSRSINTLLLYSAIHCLNLICGEQLQLLFQHSLAADHEVLKNPIVLEANPCLQLFR